MSVKNLSGDCDSGLLAGEASLSGGTQDAKPAHNVEPRTSIAFGDPEDGDLVCDPVPSAHATDGFNPSLRDWMKP
jgi:hypothetical protein